ncbi:hypothetical protein PFICI_03865 [Pestalotiopsis fici W106-1]|uniref:Peptidase M20 dimerisation domain-containing protein n=1 Tax=Pestalotiopsis fici (strain W106-1 / CGMCC3.15140) TaxID=1229662 RepID=W3XIJ0_PESFW|nr:uncharacterized protein PFICI_03865 [Pestalotiopsis fici W106-1]ETS85840.1 hypothetical protein PFICI_03865 [Pestalotiopsis fici W106-1]
MFLATNMKRISLPILYIGLFSATVIVLTLKLWRVPLAQAKISPTLLELHKSLVEISSISGTEHSISEYLASYLQQKGFTVELQNVQGALQNVYAYLGSSRSTRVLVTSHIDTVPSYFPYERRNDEIWGRGSVDDKGSVAAQITAVESLMTNQQIAEGDVGLLFVVSEETSGSGLLKANELGLSWEAVIFGEPTELKLASGHKGSTQFTVTATGKAGHSGYPEQGINAIDLLLPCLVALQEVELPSSEMFGNTTLNVGTIAGGVAANVIPASANATILVRIGGGKVSEIQEILRNEILRVAPTLDVEFLNGWGTVTLDTDIDGFENVVVNYVTDIPSLHGVHRKYLYGPGSILVSHTDHEHLTVSDLENAVEGYKTLITKNLER